MESIFFEIASIIPSSVANSFEFITVLLKALGIVVILYIIYFIIRTIFDVKRNRRIKLIELKVGSIEKKIDILLKTYKNSIKHKKSSKK